PSTPDSAVLSVAAAALSNAPPCGPGGCPRPPRRGAWLLGPGHAQGAAATALQQSFARNIGPGCPPVAACGAGARHRPRVSPYSPRGQSTVCSASLAARIATREIDSVVAASLCRRASTSSADTSAPAWARHFSGTPSVVHCPAGSFASASRNATGRPWPALRP